MTEIQNSKPTPDFEERTFRNSGTVQRIERINSSLMFCSLGFGIYLEFGAWNLEFLYGSFQRLQFNRRISIWNYTN
jgi:hypothetical protein